MSAASACARARLAAAFGKVPLQFEVNEGHVDPEVKFLTRGSGYTLFLMKTHAVLALSGSREPQVAWPTGTHELRGGSQRRFFSESSLLLMRFVGANPKPVVAGRDRLPGKSHYFIGNEPHTWRRNVPNYATVEYRGLYRGIDLGFFWSAASETSRRRAGELRCGREGA